jgi:hypothetical protein
MTCHRIIFIRNKHWNDKAYILLAKKRHMYGTYRNWTENMNTIEGNQVRVKMK